MIFEEKNQHPTASCLLFAFLALLLLSPWLLHWRELYFSEGFYATLANGTEGFPPMCKVFGEFSGKSYPLFPLLTKMFVMMGFHMETALRLVPFFSLIMLTGIVMLICSMAMDVQAALAGGAVLVTTIISCDKFSEGTPILLTSLGIFSAWMIWFNLGIWQARWHLAWICSAFVAGLTFYVAGWIGLILLIVPLFLLRRPLNFWSKPRGKAFVAGVMIIFAFILFWGSPRWNSGTALLWQQVNLELPTPKSYFLHLLLFPFDAAFRFLPWTIFAWAPFCPALQTLDKNPILSKFLRTLFLGIFILLWISPFTDSRDLLIALPPLAALIGINYWIVVRRYGWQLLRFFEFAAFVVLIIGVLALTLHLAPDRVLQASLPQTFKNLIGSTVIGGLWYCVLYALAAIFSALFCWLSARHGKPVWLVIMTLILSVMMSYYSVILPSRVAMQNHSKLGKQICSALKVGTPAAVTIYKFKSIPRLYSEMYYTGMKVRNVTSEQALPTEDKVIYVLSSVVPSAPERTWTLLQRINYKDTRLELWKGEKKETEYYDD